MKNILIIGATSAIAISCARLWAANAARFVLVARNEDRLGAIQKDLLARGAKSVNVYVVDINHHAAYDDLLTKACDYLSGIDIALVAHGTLPDQQKCEQDTNLALQEFATNGSSTVLLLLALAKLFIAQQHVRLAVITSVAGDRGRASNYVYGSAKAAVIACCEGLRARLFQHGVSLTDIRPGFVATPMTQNLSLPPLLLTTPEKIAPRILKAIERQTEVLYAPFFWSGIMLIIRHIPNAIFKRLKI